MLQDFYGYARELGFTHVTHDRRHSTATIYKPDAYGGYHTRRYRIDGSGHQFVYAAWTNSLPPRAVKL